MALSIPAFLLKSGLYFGLYIANNKVFTVFNMDQLATVALPVMLATTKFLTVSVVFRMVVVVGAPGEGNTNALVDLAVSAVDVVDDMIGDQDIAVVDGHVPLNRIPAL